MLKKANIQWSAKQLVKSIEKGTINFDNAVQRGYCWDIARQSLLIHSMIENYPIPAFFASKDVKGQYSCLDGKQRSKAISDYINNRFALTDVPEITLESGDIIDINGLTFSELSEELQDTIKDYSLTFYYFDGITEDEIASMFFRLNNGKALSSIELTRVKAKSLEKIKEIGKHEIFTSSLTEKALNKYTNEDIVIKSWMLLNVENPSFETKVIRPLVETADITDQQTEQIKLAYDRILTAYKDIKSVDDKESNKVAKRVITRTHMLSLVPVSIQSINDEKSSEEFSEFVMYFFNGKKSASISDAYNQASGSHSAHSDSVAKRITAITDAYKDFFKKSKAEKKETSTPTSSKPSTTKLSFDAGLSDREWEQSCIGVPHEVVSSFAGMY